MSAQLFSSFKLGPFALSHRIAMAPLTRMRSTQPGDVPNDLMVDYYTQRATKGGFILSEATVVSPNGSGYLGSPGIFTDDQVNGWKKIVESVHARGAVMFVQVFHVGRQSHADLQPGGSNPVAPSAMDHGGVAFTRDGWVKASPARALTEHEVDGMVEQFRLAAEGAKRAGFDGIEIHGANGYLVDQFLQDGSNQRTDRFGGSIENRARFLLEVTRGAISVFGADRVGVRIGPSGTFGDMSDSNPAALFSYVAEELNKLGIAYIHVIEPRVKGNHVDETRDQAPVASRLVRQHFSRAIVAAGGFTPESAEAIVEEGAADIVAFGRFFISNPDLPYRIAHGHALSGYDRDTFYGGTAAGYTDYPTFAETVSA
ncbi:alkene reductase [Bacillus sp. NP157]|nr:alkene reductase [Bacillus sp. NP157]